MPDRQTPRKNDEISILFQDHQAEQLVQIVAAQIEYHSRVSEKRKDSYKLVSLSAGTRVDGRWTIIKEIAQGAFSTVFLCSGNTDAGRQQAAMKTERADEEPFLWQEAEILRKMSTEQGGEHFCRWLGEGRDFQRNTKSGKLVTMSLTGPGLFDLLSEAGDVFSPGTAIGVSIQLLHALKTLHSAGYLHLDVKPENAAIGRADTKEERRIFLIDFGLARRYIRNDGRARRQRSRTHFRGTPMYASIAAHARADYCRASDIESWFYTLVDMYTGKLPWTHVKSERRMGKMKRRRLSHKPEVRRKALSDLESWLYTLVDMYTGKLPWTHVTSEHRDALHFLDRRNYDEFELALRNYLKSTRSAS
ncbi:hypothetical protein niasHS_012001 [Heterodera schachtii]|uniref:Protein kinase domain-containing protein n=1 Tax=Heterodera schachtii TaxID=97005 RepID=A0ABD2I4T8_HETSC